MFGLQETTISVSSVFLILLVFVWFVGGGGGGGCPGCDLIAKFLIQRHTFTLLGSDVSQWFVSPVFGSSVSPVSCRLSFRLGVSQVGPCFPCGLKALSPSVTAWKPLVPVEEWLQVVMSRGREG